MSIEVDARDQQAIVLVLLDVLRAESLPSSRRTQFNQQTEEDGMQRLMIVVAATVGVFSGVTVNLAFAGQPVMKKEAAAVLPLLPTCRGCSNYTCRSGCQYFDLHCDQYPEGCISYGDCYNC
jgi:hypothetical protein